MPNHQFSLFNFETMRPRFKVPISADRIKEVKKLINQGDGKKAADRLREVRESLEDFEQRISKKVGVGTGKEIVLVRNKAGVLKPVYLMPTCPKCGSTMTGGAPHGPWPVQYECHNCGHISTSLR